MKMEQTVCSEMSAYKIQTRGNYPEENIQQWGNVFRSHRSDSEYMMLWTYECTVGPQMSAFYSHRGLQW